jgi:hypothetical protein
MRFAFAYSQLEVNVLAGQKILHHKPPKFLMGYQTSVWVPNHHSSC